MKLKNAFSDDTRQLFWEARYRCWRCKGNGTTCGGIELHHITGRDSSSPFNAAPLCKLCHSVVGHTDKEEQLYFRLTMEYLWGKTTVTKEDEAFMLAHPHLLINLPVYT